MDNTNYTPEPYLVYVQTDEARRITAINSSAFVSPDWGTEIDQGTGDRYHHAQNHYLAAPLYTSDSIPRYKLVDGAPVERTEEEISSDRSTMLGDEIRTKRDALLAETDWTQLPDAPLSDDQKEQAREYRQMLRDIPQQDGFPAEIIWPEVLKL